MEDYVGAAGNRRSCGGQVGDVGGDRRDRRGEILRAWRNADVEQSEAVDRSAVERAISDQARRQLAPDHSRGAGDKDVHCGNRR